MTSKLEQYDNGYDDGLAAAKVEQATELIGRFESLLARLRYCDDIETLVAEHKESRRAFLPFGTDAEHLRSTCEDWLREIRGEVPDSAMVCPNCGEPAGVCECSMPEVDAQAEARAAIDEANS